MLPLNQTWRGWNAVPVKFSQQGYWKVNETNTQVLGPALGTFAFEFSHAFQHPRAHC